MVTGPTFGATETSSEPFPSGKVIPEGSTANPQENAEEFSNRLPHWLLSSHTYTMVFITTQRDSLGN